MVRGRWSGPRTDRRRPAVERLRAAEQVEHTTNDPALHSAYPLRRSTHPPHSLADVGPEQDHAIRIPRRGVPEDVHTVAGGTDPLLDDVGAVEEAVLVGVVGEHVAVRRARRIGARRVPQRAARAVLPDGPAAGSPPTITSCGGVHGPHGWSAVRMRTAPLPMFTAVHSAPEKELEHSALLEHWRRQPGQTAAVEHHPFAERLDPRDRHLVRDVVNSSGCTPVARRVEVERLRVSLLGTESRGAVHAARVVVGMPTRAAYPPACRRMRSTSADCVRSSRPRRTPDAPRGRRGGCHPRLAPVEESCCVVAGSKRSTVRVVTFTNLLVSHSWTRRTRFGVVWSRARSVPGCRRRSAGSTPVAAQRARRIRAEPAARTALVRGVQHRVAGATRSAVATAEVSVLLLEYSAPK